mgnify:CR=1 FL=1
MDRAEKLRGSLKVVVAAVGFASLLVGPGRTFSSEWNVVPDPDRDNIPGVERDGTLRVVRFTGDFDAAAQDQGTLVGWVNAAAKGKLEERKTAPAADGTMIDVWESEEMQRR